jgi:hypothetical protein
MVEFGLETSFEWIGSIKNERRVRSLTENSLTLSKEWDLVGDIYAARLTQSALKLANEVLKLPHDSRITRTSNKSGVSKR